MSEVPDEDDWIAALLPRFLELTAERLTRIEVEQRSLRSKHTCDQAILEIGSITHKIVGTAGNFGFHALGDAATKAEEACKCVQKPQAPAMDSDCLYIIQAKINRLIEEMRLVLARR